MVLSILFFPLLSIVFVLLFSSFLGILGSVFIGLFGVFFSCVLSLYLFFNNFLSGYVGAIKFFGSHWVIHGPFIISWNFCIDSVTVFLAFVVTFISFLVHFYSIGYMAGDRNFLRFVCYLSLFTFFMLFLLLSDTVFTMFVGWEGVGLCSFFLINFWYNRREANQSAIKAVVVNRFGDYGITLGIIFLFFQFFSFDYSTYFALSGFLAETKLYFLNDLYFGLNLAGAFLFLGAVGKSAQIGLHTWLPDAMEGPTPVSALIHAATMVTAGVYLLIRFSPLLEFAPTILEAIWLFGVLTAFFAGSVGLLQNDLKKVIAYSTCSQLGYMVLACGISHYQVSLFHLFNHAFFKALLFLSAGAVIHAMGDEQDMRKLGGLVKVLPFTYTMFIFGSLALMGFPFLAGFYSKELILEVAFANFKFGSQFSFWLGSLAAGFTAFYSFRLIYFVFLSEANGYKAVYQGAHEPVFFMSIPLIFLFLGSIFSGFVFQDFFIGLGSDFFADNIFIHPGNYLVGEGEFLKRFFGLPFLCSLAGVVVCLLFFTRGKDVQLFNFRLYRLFSKFLFNKWYFDLLYNRIFVYYFFNLGFNVFLQILDRGLFSFLAIEGPTKGSLMLGRLIGGWATGFIAHYLLLFLTGVLVLLFFLMSFSLVSFEFLLIGFWLGVFLCVLNLKEVSGNTFDNTTY